MQTMVRYVALFAITFTFYLVYTYYLSNSYPRPTSSHRLLKMLKRHTPHFSKTFTILLIDDIIKLSVVVCLFTMYLFRWLLFFCDQAKFVSFSTNLSTMRRSLSRYKIPPYHHISILLLFILKETVVDITVSYTILCVTYIHLPSTITLVHFPKLSIIRILNHYCWYLVLSVCF